MQGSQPDPFGTADLRRRVLDAWTASPARFREDANAEEDYALGGYRDRVIVELAQNAADAAARAGVPGRLRLTLRSGTLEAANTGAPLTAAGVAALSTLRASSKRGPGAQQTQARAPRAEAFGPGASGAEAPGAAVPGVEAPGAGVPGVEVAGAEVAGAEVAGAEVPGAEVAGAEVPGAEVAGAEVPGAEVAGVGAPGTRAPGAHGSGVETAGRQAREMVGRFGVGFAAAVAVSDEPRICSLTGAVTWSRRAAADLVRRIPELAGEFGLRSGHVPVLRLPFAADGAPPEGFATAVTLPLRDDAAGQLIRRLLAETGPALLIALPALATIEIEADGAPRILTAARDGNGVTITVDGAAARWRTAAAAGQADPRLLADRPAEERARPSWSVRWAVPVAPGGEPAGTPARRLPDEVAPAPLPPDEPPGLDTPAGRLPNGLGGPLAPVDGPSALDPPAAGLPGAAGGGPAGGPGLDTPAGRLPDGVGGVVHAPTPTDEPLGLPALLLASFPLSPDRRHVAPGPLTDFLVDRAAEVYARLMPGLAPGPGLLDLVPGPVASGELDARVRRAILARLRDTAFLPAAGPGGPRVRPRDAVILDANLPGLDGCLAPVLDGLVTGPARHPAFAVLGVRQLRLAELADMLASLDRDPAWWRRLYDALGGADPGELSELGALPVPLADGRLVRGPRGLLLPGPGVEQAGRLRPLGVRVVHPGAVHPLLARLGAIEATPRGVLADPAVRAAVEASYDEDDPGPIAEAVLSLVAAAHLRPGELPWLAGLALPGADGDWYPAGELLFPDGPLAGVVAADTPFGILSPAVLGRHSAATLEAVGVLSSFGLLAAEDVALDDPGLDLDGAEDWAADTCARLPAGGVPPVAAEVLAVRDLELVDPARWPRALDMLAEPALRAAIVEPTRVLLADGRHADVPSYTAWWLRHHPVLGGHRAADVRAADADPLLAGLYDEVVLTVDPAVARALGVRTSVAVLLDEPGGADELLDRLADPARTVTRAQLRLLWAALAAVPQATAPDQVRAVQGEKVVVAGAGDALVLDTPDLWPLVSARPLVLAPYDRAERLADLLDLPLVSEEVSGLVESSPQRRPVPAIVSAVLPGAPATYEAHDRLVVDGISVPWRYTGGAVHAAGPGGLARGLAWASGRWPLRHLLAALLRDPGEATRLLAEADLDPDLPSGH
ncbi:MAG TPA: hypothetical protein VKS82_10905 [Streptosporangiaceae bacterium]|nr:hypothetical protein [Streptosporangiaceae bacterium]